jgi:hypothetical protein
MKTSLLSVVAGLGLLTVSASAFAGAHYLYQVTFGSNYAYGTVPGAYQSSDSTQLIGCNSYSYASGSASGSCYAYNSSGSYKSCVTSLPEQLEVIRSVGPGSYIYFRVASDNYSCDQVSVTNGSHYTSY